MDATDPDEVSTSSDQDQDDDLLGDLESLLEEEGNGLDQGEALAEDDLADIFEDDGPEVPTGPAQSAPAPPAGRTRRGGPRTNREERKIAI